MKRLYRLVILQRKVGVKWEMTALSKKRFDEMVEFMKGHMPRDYYLQAYRDTEDEVIKID